MDLLKLNRDFYLTTQVHFNTSRQAPWDGWKKLLSYLQGQTLQEKNGRFQAEVKRPSSKSVAFYLEVEDAADNLISSLVSMDIWPGFYR